MPTASSFSWSLPWQQVAGGFNNFMGMLNTPVALALSLILVFVVASLIINAVRQARAGAAVSDLLTHHEDTLRQHYREFDDDPYWDDDLTDEERRELAEDYYWEEMT